MFVCKDKHKTNAKLNRVFLKSHVPIEVTSEQFEVAWAGGELLDPADWADMPAGTCVEITWATLQGKRPDDEEPLTMEWLAGAIEWTKQNFENNCAELRLFRPGVEVIRVVYRGRKLDQICVQLFCHGLYNKTRGQFRALCKALGIEIKEGV
jgi:hypothetical protein